MIFTRQITNCVSSNDLCRQPRKSSAKAEVLDTTHMQNYDDMKIV